MCDSPHSHDIQGHDLKERSLTGSKNLVYGHSEGLSTLEASSEKNLQTSTV